MQVDGKGTVEKRIAGAFKAASDATGTSFDYLLSTSTRESDNRLDATTSTSTARGLFQFLDQEWLELVRREGPSIGLEAASRAVVPDGKGNWTVADPKQRADILALRDDPLVASVMAARATQDNARRLGDALGRAPTDGELYAAHFLGPTGAVKLLKLAASDPQATAATVFPKAAAANSAIFYDRTGRARTIAELATVLTTPRETAADPTARRIAEAHAALTAKGGTVDPSSLALLVRAQASSVVGADALGIGAGGSAGDRAFLRAAFADVAMPGEDPARQAGGLDGWRARAAQDAFSGLMRDETSDAAGDDSLPGTRAFAGLAAPKGARLASAALPGLPLDGAASLDPGAPTAYAASAPAAYAAAAAAAAATGATPPLPPVPAAPPTRVAPAQVASAQVASAPAAAGAIARVDPYAPMNLGAPTSTQAQATAPAQAAVPTVAAAAPAAAAVVARTVAPSAAAGSVASGAIGGSAPAAAAAVPVRPSRLVSEAATGSPAMPLPVVDTATGATRPSRLLFAAYDRPSEEARAAGVVVVRTTTVAPPSEPTVAPAFTAPTPPVRPARGGATAAAASTSSAAADEPGHAVRRRPRADNRPLDLLALARRARAAS